MLVLTRRKNEKIVFFVRSEEKQCLVNMAQSAERDDIIPLINSTITIKVDDIQNGQVKLSFDGPRHFSIMRSEIYIPTKEISRPVPVRKKNVLKKIWNKLCA
ncbi:MAG: carbon storage regulator [Patescibacteria group bacterium]